MTPYATVYPPGKYLDEMTLRLQQTMAGGFRAIKIEEWPGILGNVDLAIAGRVVSVVVSVAVPAAVAPVSAVPSPGTSATEEEQLCDYRAQEQDQQDLQEERDAEQERAAALRERPGVRVGRQSRLVAQTATREYQSQCHQTEKYRSPCYLILPNQDSLSLAAEYGGSVESRGRKHGVSRLDGPLPVAPLIAGHVLAEAGACSGGLTPPVLPANPAKRSGRVEVAPPEGSRRL